MKLERLKDGRMSLREGTLPPSVMIEICLELVLATADTRLEGQQWSGKKRLVSTGKWNLSLGVNGPCPGFFPFKDKIEN